MKKCILLLGAAIAILSLSSCSSIKNMVGDWIFQESGISADEAYQTYQSLNTAGELDADGYYIDTTVTESETEVSEDEADTSMEMTGTIHVTFAENQYLDIEYYADEGLTQKIPTDACYMNAGDVIYMSTPESSNPYSNIYQFSEFVVYEYSQDGSKTEIDRTTPTGNIAYQLPSTFEGTELALVPIGEYPARALSMRADYKNEAGTVCTLASSAGTWYVDGKEYESDAATISPTDSYTVSFDWDQENYFYVDATPACFSVDDEVGKVEFPEASPTDEAQNYYVELHPYLELTIELSEKGTVSLNGADASKVKKGKSWSCDKLKYGDEIVIETSGECHITAGDYSYVQSEQETLGEGYRYTFKIQEESDPEAAHNQASGVTSLEIINVTFDTDDSFGTCKFKCGKTELSGPSEVKVGDKVTLTYTLTDKNYKYAESGSSLKDKLKKRKRTVTIVITAEMDGTTICREDCIEIAKKEE